MKKSLRRVLQRLRVAVSGTAFPKRGYVRGGLPERRKMRPVHVPVRSAARG